MWVSVHLWKVIITGAKMLFIATLTAKATPTLPPVRVGEAKTRTASTLVWLEKMVSITTGMPLWKIVMAIRIPMPRNPHTIMRGTMPKPGSL